MVGNWIWKQLEFETENAIPFMKEERKGGKEKGKRKGREEKRKKGRKGRKLSKHVQDLGCEGYKTPIVLFWNSLTIKAQLSFKLNPPASNFVKLALSEGAAMPSNKTLIKEKNFFFKNSYSSLRRVNVVKMWILSTLTYRFNKIQIRISASCCMDETRPRIANAIEKKIKIDGLTHLISALLCSCIDEDSMHQWNNRQINRAVSRAKTLSH